MAFTNSHFHPLEFTGELPEKILYPFFYRPHAVAKKAAEELKEYLALGTIDHLFNQENSNAAAIGKMFGVLVVKNKAGELGYLAGVSGKMANSNHHPGFVPPIYDMLEENSYFRVGERELAKMTVEIKALENSEERSLNKEKYESTKQACEKELEDFKQKIKQTKRDRDERRSNASELSEDEFKKLQLELSEESKKEQIYLKWLRKQIRERLEKAESEYQAFENKIEELRAKRAQTSKRLQDQLFQSYIVENANNKEESILEIFHNWDGTQPPAGTGECAAPKLFQFAFQNNYTPVALAEFWWGESPKSEVRKHEQYYPCCRGKCEPVLSFMLQGLKVEENPLLQNPGVNKTIEILYEDEDIAIVNKPHDLLSVPGKNIEDSVWYRMKQNHPDWDGPIIVHRLDMATSGILVLTKNIRAYQFLQSQFIKRRVEKQYTAILTGTIEQEKGVIDLPLRVDLLDRPKQLVCYEHGKPAVTEFEVVSRENGETRIHFFPKTGRTHQLRVHSAHSLGLKFPIKGDDLYGTVSNRLHLHAERIAFKHPRTKEMFHFHIPAEF
ncbi:MAG: pseudouridine synthase [Crocinitomicaceae bacterium]|jgi:tRNA pseudouridine32 synthase/23S rRNA pseudouridine746 synthase|nr:pseudouridine synthase [Crocinitomicaceae bacterium]